MIYDELITDATRHAEAGSPLKHIYLPRDQYDQLVEEVGVMPGYPLVSFFGIPISVVDRDGD